MGRRGLSWGGGAAVEMVSMVLGCGERESACSKSAFNGRNDPSQQFLLVNLQIYTAGA